MARDPDASRRPPTAPPLPRSVAVNNRHPRLKVPSRAIAKAIALLDRDRARFDGGCPAGELSIAFLTDVAIAAVHRDFMDDPTPTDVITFEGDLASELAGEICVSADTAASYARAHRREFSSELMLYVVHGWLHLAGYDDLQPAKKRRMRAAEQRAMTLLERHDAIPRFALR